MKKYIFLSAMSIALLASTTSCDMEVADQTGLSSEEVYSNVDIATTAVMSIIQSFGETNSYRGRYLPYYGLNTDVEWINSPDGTKPLDAKQSLGNYNTQGNNTNMNTENNAYAKFYEGIERANLAIEGIAPYKDQDSELGQLYGEAITLRSVLYLDLIKGWGDVPERRSPITSETMYQPRVDRDTIYKHLLNDLAEASEYCAWPNETSVTETVERVSKSFCKALRARIALYAGGYSQRSDGTIRLSNDPELAPEKMYQIVKDECTSIISGQHNKLSSSFEQVFKNLCLEDLSAGGESIYEIPFSAGRGRVLYTFGVKHNSADQYTGQAQGGVNGPVPTLFYDYDIDDVRRDITCVPYEWSAATYGGDDGTVLEKPAQQQLRSLNKWCFGKLRYEWMTRRVTSTNDDGINWQYMRMGDVYLMAAEAINQLEGPSAAWTYMKPILDRALPSDKVTALQAKYTASKDAFQEGIEEQRAFELAGEMLRKADLIRWNKLESKLAETKTKLDQLRNRQGTYADLPTKLYTTIADDGESLIIYGLNHGETDEAGSELETQGYTATTWISNTKIEDKNIDGLYVVSPDEHQFWPIWDTFVNNSNGTLKSYFTDK